MTVDDFRRRRVRADTQTSRRRAYDLLRSGIRSGAVEEQLVEEGLTHSLWTSRNAVREALRMLVDEGMVSRRPKHGTSVLRRVPSIPLQELMPPPTGYPGEARVRVEQLEVRSVPLTGVIAQRLCAEGESVILSEQLLYLGQEPVSLRTAYLVTDQTPEQVAQRLDVIDSQHIPSARAFELFFGVPVSEVESYIEAIPGEREACQALGMTIGAPVLFRESLHRDTNGRPRLLIYAHYRGDRISLSSLVRVGDDLSHDYAETVCRQA